jgi:predicted DNA-binding protein (MmcQ/YjbR family)
MSARSARANAPVEIREDIVERLSSLCLALPEVTVRVDGSLIRARSTAHSFDMRRRSFCLLMAREDSTGKPVALLVLHADPDERDALLSSGHPYFAPRAGHDRIGVLLTDGTDWEELHELVTESYRILAPKKLTHCSTRARWPSRFPMSAATAPSPGTAAVGRNRQLSRSSSRE